MMHPAFENNLSGGALGAGTHRCFRANSEITGNQLQFCFHYCSTLTSAGVDASCTCICISSSTFSLTNIFLR